MTSDDPVLVKIREDREHGRILSKAGMTAIFLSIMAQVFGFALGQVIAEIVGGDNSPFLWSSAIVLGLFTAYCFIGGVVTGLLMEADKLGRG